MMQTKRSYNKVMCLKMQMKWQSVKILIRLLFYEQSDLDLHCLCRPTCPNTKFEMGMIARIMYSVGLIIHFFTQLLALFIDRQVTTIS